MSHSLKFISKLALPLVRFLAICSCQSPVLEANAALLPHVEHNSQRG